MDSLSHRQAGAQLDRVSQKANTVVRKTKVNVNAWKAEVDALLDKCDHSLENAQGALESIANTGESRIKELNALIARTRELLETVKKLKDQSNTVLAKLLEGDNTAGMVIDQASPLNKGLDKLLKDVDALLSDIKKNGLDINVDIF
jgi:phospholipid/cholesterol/gamma-HCH transport system substrate-binding protein